MGEAAGVAAAMAARTGVSAARPRRRAACERHARARWRHHRHRHDRAGVMAASRSAPSGSPWWLGFDIGGTRLKAGRVGADGRVAGAVIIETDSERFERIWERILDYGRSAIASHGQAELQGVGVALPGLVEPEFGSRHLPGKVLGIEGFPLRERLEAEFGVPRTLRQRRGRRGTRGVAIRCGARPRRRGRPDPRHRGRLRGHPGRSAADQSAPGRRRLVWPRHHPRGRSDLPVRQHRLCRDGGLRERRRRTTARIRDPEGAVDRHRALRGRPGADRLRHHDRGGAGGRPRGAGGPRGSSAGTSARPS